MTIFIANSVSGAIESLSRLGSQGALVPVAIADVILIAIYYFYLYRRQALKSQNGLTLDKAMAEKGDADQISRHRPNILSLLAQYLAKVANVTAAEFNALINLILRVALTGTIVVLTAALLAMYMYGQFVLAHEKGESENLQFALHEAVGAKTAVEASDRNQALQKMNALRMRFASPDVAMYLADLQSDSGNYPDALDNYRYAEKLFNGKTAKTQVGIAVAMLGLRYFEDARTALKTALQLAALESNDSTNLKFMIYVDLGKSYLEEGVGVKDKAARTQLLLQAQKMYTKAQEFTTGANSLQISALYSNMGKLYLNLKMPDQAQVEFENQVKVESKLMRESYFHAQLNLGIAYASQDQKQQAALQTLLKVAPELEKRLDPNSATAWLMIGDVYLNLEKPSQARGAFNKAITIGREVSTQNLAVAERADSKLRAMTHQGQQN